MRLALLLCILLATCTILFTSCEDNPTESVNNSIFLHKFVDTELFGNDIDASITFITDTLIDEHGYYYTVQMPTINILLVDSLMRLSEAMFFFTSYDKQNYEIQTGFMAGTYWFQNKTIFTYTPRQAGYDKLYILAQNYSRDKTFFDVCIRYR